MPIRTAAAMHGATGWIMAMEFENEQPRGHEPDAVLTHGRYVAALNRVDCEGCAAAVESAVQRVHGVEMAGVAPKTSTLIFEVAPGANVHLADIEGTLMAVSEAVKSVISVSGLRGPLPVMFSAA